MLAFAWCAMVVRGWGAGRLQIGGWTELGPRCEVVVDVLARHGCWGLY